MYTWKFSHMVVFLFKNNLPTFLHVSGTAKLKFKEGNFRCDDVPVLRVTVVSVSHGGFNQRKHIRNQPNQNQPSSYDLTVWCFQTFFIFTPKPWGKIIQFDESYFSDGLVQPPTSLMIERNQSTKKSTQGFWDSICCCTQACRQMMDLTVHVELTSWGGRKKGIWRNTRRQWRGCVVNMEWIL